MANELVKSNPTTLTITPGAVSLEGLTEIQQNELRMYAAKNGVDLAADAATRKMRLEASAAEVDMTTNAIGAIRRAGGKYDIKMTAQTATGAISIRAKKGVIFD